VLLPPLQPLNLYRIGNFPKNVEVLLLCEFPPLRKFLLDLLAAPSIPRTLLPLDVLEDVGLHIDHYLLVLLQLLAGDRLEGAPFLPKVR
jgi:hypothetical protein